MELLVCEPFIPENAETFIELSLSPQTHLLHITAIMIQNATETDANHLVEWHFTSVLEILRL